MITFYLLLAALAAPQLDIDTNGPYEVGFKDVSFHDANFNQGALVGRVYYPATAAGASQPLDVSSGPFPLVGFAHGWTEPVTDYAPLLSHLASWGFVVAGIGTEDGYWADMRVEARDLRSLLHWCEDASFDSNSWLHQGLDHQQWGAAGHSMGGAAMGYLVMFESRISDVVMLEPYHGSFLGSSYDALNQFNSYTGRCLIVAGSEDSTCPPGSTVKPWFDKTRDVENSFFVNIQGGGHFGATIWPGWEGSLAASEQQRMHFRLLTSFMLSGLKGEHDRMAAIAGFESDSDPSVKESSSPTPSIWVGQDSSALSELIMGIAGQPNSRAKMAYSFNQGAQQTRFGLVEIDLASAYLFIDTHFPASGILEETIFLPPTWTGMTLYIQGANIFGGAGAVSRATSFFVP
jgi:hypothetical protein